MSGAASLLSPNCAGVERFASGFPHDIRHAVSPLARPAGIVYDE
jgi:hypothetical protein